MYFPASQAVHEVAVLLPVLYRPDWHTAQVLLLQPLLTVQYFPAAQLPHTIRGRHSSKRTASRSSCGVPPPRIFSARLLVFRMTWLSPAWSLRCVPVKLLLFLPP